MAHEMSPAKMSSSMGMSMGPGSMSFATFVGAWVAMMGAMMFPAILPVVGIYRRAAGMGRAAPTPVFVAGYLIVWSIVAVPAYFAWRALAGPMGSGASWVARLAGAVLLVAAIYQLSPLKTVCLRHCRSPLSFFMRLRSNLKSPIMAARAGASHGFFCLGCCWALMAILIAVGTMQLVWMIALAGLIFVEKVSPIGEQVARAMAGVFVALGVALLAYPAVFSAVT
jgi:predicted metal-binding membrane protein